MMHCERKSEIQQGTGFYIRKATASDANGIERLWEGLFLYETRMHQALETVPFSSVSLLKLVKKRMQSKDSAFFVAVMGKQTVGYIEIEMHERFEGFLLRKEAFVVKLFVEAQYRCKGIGTCLLETAETWARAQGGQILMISAALKNRRAIQLYCAIGFDRYNIKLTKSLESI